MFHVLRTNKGSETIIPGGIEALQMVEIERYHKVQLREYKACVVVKKVL